MDEQKREYKRKYVGRFDIVKRVINQWDPIGFFPGEAAPLDEYEPEIAQIVLLVNKNANELVIAEGIYKVFLRWFGDDMTHCFPMEDCRRVATQIRQAITDDMKRD